jgi:hypothetical protein
VLTLWAERSWESCRQRALGRPVTARSLPRTKNSERARTGGYRTKLPIPLPRGPLWFVLGLHFFLGLPRGEQRCGRCWSQLGGGHSGDALWRGLGGGRPRRWCVNRAYAPIRPKPVACCSASIELQLDRGGGAGDLRLLLLLYFIHYIHSAPDPVRAKGTRLPALGLLPLEFC